MTRTTRATSGEASAAPAKSTRNVFKKRGVFGTEDNDDDPTQPTDELLAAFNKRSLTKMDKFLILGIEAMEGEGGNLALNFGVGLAMEEADAAAKNLPLDCHTKIYWRFIDLFVRRNGRSPHELHSGVFRQPEARRASSSSRRSPERRAPAMTRPVRGAPSESPEPPSRVRSGARVTKSTPAPTGRASKRRAPPLDRPPPAISESDSQFEKAFRYYQKLAYECAREGKTMPPMSAKMAISKEDYYNATDIGQQAGLEARERDQSNARVTGEAASPGKSPTRSSRSPGKQPAVNKAPESPVKAREPGRGTIDSTQNPEFIMVKGVEQQNPFHESMPAPEVWHRRMPPVFPFGETPFMAQVVSDQINADLSRSKSRSVYSVLIAANIDHHRP